MKTWFETLSTKRKWLLSVAAFFLLAVVYSGVRLGMLIGYTQHSLATVSELQNSQNLTIVTARDKITTVADDLSIAATAAGDPMVAALDVLPWVGSDIHAVRVAITSVSDVVASIEPLVNIATSIEQSADGVAPTVKSTFARELGRATTMVSQRIALANVELSKLDPSSLHFGLSEKVETLKQGFVSASSALEVIEPAAQAISVVFGSDQPTKWFVATQNLAEVRATGGLLGSFAIISVTDGKVKLEEAGSDVKLLSRGALDYANYPADLVEVWGADMKDWRDINASAHVPYFAELVHDGWLRNFGEDIDGVLLIGQGTVAYLVAATGPIEIDGKTISAENVMDYMSKTIYADYTDVKKKNAFVTTLMTELFKKVSEGNLDFAAMVRASINIKSGDRIAAWAADTETQAKIEKTSISGYVPENFGSYTQLTVNNAGGNKLDAYLSVDARYEQLDCGQMTYEGLQGRNSKVTVKITNGAPAKGLPKYVTPRLDLTWGEPHTVGSNRELVTLYAPVGSSDNGILLDGEEIGATFAYDRQHPVYVVQVELEPGETRTLEYNFIEPTVDATGVEIRAKQTLVPPVMLNKPTVSLASTGICKPSN